MSTDFSPDLPPPPDDALAALMASPEYQAQMAAMTQQAMAALQAMVAALNAAAAQMAAGTPKLPSPVDPLIDIPIGPPQLSPPEPLPPELRPTIIDVADWHSVDPIFLSPAVLPGGGEKNPPGEESHGPTLARGAVSAPAVLFPADVITEAHFVEMLGMLPRAPSAMTFAADSTPVAAAAGIDESPILWAPLVDDRGIGEGGAY